jgi:hypothetical protein
MQLQNVQNVILIFVIFRFRYVASINQRWFKRIMSMVPRRLLRNQKEIKKIHEEIKVSHFTGQTNKGQQETLRAGKQILKTIFSIIIFFLGHFE